MSDVREVDAVARARRPGGAVEALGEVGFFEQRGPRGVLLIHGITGAPAEMRFLARRLARDGYTVACPQLAGHCQSLRSMKRTRWEDWYGSVSQAFDFLAARCEAVYAAGLSMGALLGLRLAMERGAGLAGLATLAATFFYDGWNVPHLKRRLLLPLVVHSPLKYFLSYREPPPYGIKDERIRGLIEAVYGGQEAPDPGKAGYDRFPAVTIAETFRLIRAVRRGLGQVVAPTLIMHSTEDDMASEANARYLAERLGSPRVETHLVDDCYHVLSLDRRRDDVAVWMGRFFRDCRPQAAEKEGARAVAGVG